MYVVIGALMHVHFFIISCLYVLYILSCSPYSQAIIRVCISDINDNCPEIMVPGGDTASYTESEDASATDTLVRTITIEDIDSDPNAELTVRIENPSGIGTDAFPFYLTNLGPTASTLVSGG